MGCKILSEGGGTGPAALYDSVTMAAFGPVMPNATWAEGFLKWLESNTFVGDRDPGPADGQSLIDSWAEYESAHAECVGCGVNMARRPDSGEALCEECKADEEQRPSPTAPLRRGSRYHMASSLFGPARPANQRL
jgi:Zn ribbon nucleic-acid-binding protein